MSHWIERVEVTDNSNRNTLTKKVQKTLASRFAGERNYERAGELYSEDVEDYPVKFVESRAASYDEASKILDSYEDEAHFGCKIVAVSYSVPNKTKKAADIRRRIEETETKLTTYLLSHSLAKKKAEFFSCPECRSRIARRIYELGGRLENNGEKFDVCPVCGAVMNSETDKKTVEGYKEKIKRLKKELRVEEGGNTRSGKKVWVCMTSVHC